MTQADITVVTESQLPVIVELYNQVFRPPENENYFRRRFQGRYNVLAMLASLDNRPVGFCVGFELKPLVFLHLAFGSPWRFSPQEHWTPIAGIPVGMG